MSTPTRPPRAYLLAWSLYPLLVPFYLMGKTPVPGGQKLASGVPQIADYYLLALAAVVFLALPLRAVRPAAAVVRAVLAFVAYTCLVNAAWAMLLNDTSLLKSSAFYAYDALLFLTFLALYSRFGERLLRVTVHAVAASVLLQLALSPLAVATSYPRESLFFNDENQLGYFCVLAATIFALGAARFPVRPALRFAFYGSVGYLAYLSQCRGALLGLGTLVLVALLGRPVRLALAAAGLAAVLLAVEFAPQVLDKEHERLTVHGEHDNFATRGYDRILNYPEYLLFGSGEGAYGRFRSDLYGTELHSSYGTLVFCYGLVGAGCFVAALFFLGRRDLRAALYLLPAFVYGSAHHGLRFAFFWAMLAFVVCVAVDRQGKPLAA